MELFEILKQFKKIEADPAFTEKSRRAVLATTPREPWSARKIIISIFETTIAVGFVGFLIFVVTGQFSGSTLSPKQFSVINPESLKAEAQAVDIQIQLANLTYQVSTTTGAASTPQVAAAIIAKQPALLIAVASSTDATSTDSVASSSATSTASSTTVSIDEALKALSK